MMVTVTARGPLSAVPAAGPCRAHHALRRLGGGHPRDPPGRGEGDCRPSCGAGRMAELPRGWRQTLQGDRAAGRFYFEHPRKESVWRDTCHLPCILTGTLFGAVLGNQEPRLAVPDSVLRVGGGHAAPGPALGRQSEPLSSFPAIFLLLSTPSPPLSPFPAAFGSSLFCWGRDAGGDLKNQNC